MGPQGDGHKAGLHLSYRGTCCKTRCFAGARFIIQRPVALSMGAASTTRCPEATIHLAQMLHFPCLIFNLSFKKVKPWCWALLGSCTITLLPASGSQRIFEEMRAHPGTSQQQPVLRMCKKQIPAWAAAAAALVWSLPALAPSTMLSTSPMQQQQHFLGMPGTA